MMKTKTLYKSIKKYGIKLNNSFLNECLSRLAE